MQACRPIKNGLQENKVFCYKHKGWKLKCAQMHIHTLKSSASHLFTSEQREWTFNCNITKAWSHLGSKSVLISPDHTHSCLLYFPLFMKHHWLSQSSHLTCFKNCPDLVMCSKDAHACISDSKGFVWFFHFACFSSKSQRLLIAISYVVLLDRSLRQNTSKSTELLWALAISP